MFIAALLTIVPVRKPPKCPLMDEWIDKMWHTYTWAYSASRGKEILTHATTWVSLEDVKLVK
jgi:hypothetical protein